MTQLIDWLTQHGLSYLIIGLSIFWPGYLLGVKVEKNRNTGYDGAEIILHVVQVITW